MIKAFLYKSANLFGIRIAYSRLFLGGPHCVILAYHRIGPLGANLLLKDLTVEPEAFNWQIEYLKKNYEIIPLASLESFLKQLKNKRARAAVVTFDDGYEDNYVYALPAIKKHNIPAAIFIPTAFVGSKKAFWWETLAWMLGETKLPALELKHNGQARRFRLNGKTLPAVFKALAGLFKHAEEAERSGLLRAISDLLKVKSADFYSPVLGWRQMKEMLNYNISFGAHTHNHCRLAGLSGERLAEELRLPKVFLENGLGRKVEDFAYPFGEKSDFDSRAQDELIRQGYKRAVTMSQGPVFGESNLLCLNRIGVGGNDTKETFKLKLSGLLPFGRK